jgi:RNA polymerase sigma-70 factor (ECF subfamily)
MLSMDGDDEDVEGLLARVRDGDPAAIRQLYMRCSVVYAHVLRLCGDPVLAREVHHDTVTEIWKGKAPFRGEARFATWVSSIARHLAFRAMRSRARESVPWLAPDGDEEGPVEPRTTDGTSCGDPMGIFADRQRREGVLCCIGKLPPKLGECLLLVYYAEMSQTEIAALLGLNVNTVKSRVRDAHRRIAQCLKRLAH